MENQWQTYFEQNRKIWNDRVETHLKSDFYDHTSFMAGKSSLTEIEANALGDVNGKTLLHLQCHFGQDSLSWARQGALVTGIDFSENAIETAKQINDELGLNARFLNSDVYQLPEVLSGKFDIVFSTFGAIPWLPDLEKWADVVSHFLKPGGIFYLAEFHPTFYLFNFENHKVEYGYFTEGKPYSEEISGTYADRYAGVQGLEHFWNHSLSEVMSPLLKNGLQVLDFQEFDFSPYNCFPNMVEREPGRFCWGNFGVRIPHIFSLKMQKRT
ncbi:MAG: methyltransferase domain-containing protein [Bacteroidetes bacterium]|nr:methyltransferase domain-containing protein [Bacteroidota bacterium]